MGRANGEEPIARVSSRPARTDSDDGDKSARSEGRRRRCKFPGRRCRVRFRVDGRLIVNPAHRAGFQSREILRAPDGSFTITVSPVVAPGNWLPTGHVENLQLVLRLYDTPLTTAADFTNMDMPSIDKVSCG